METTNLDYSEIKEVEDIIKGDDTFTFSVSDIMNFGDLIKSDLTNKEKIKDTILNYIEDVLRIDYVIDFEYTIEDNMITVFNIEKFSNHFS